MRYPSGNFDGHDWTLEAEGLAPQLGKFGYLEWWDKIRLRGSRLSVEPDALIARQATDPKEIRIEAAKGGFKLECLGFEDCRMHRPWEKPGPNAIPVKLLVIGGKQYKRWDNDISYRNIETLAIGERPCCFIERHHIAETRLGVRLTRRSSGVKKRAAPIAYPSVGSVRTIIRSSFPVRAGPIWLLKISSS